MYRRASARHSLDTSRLKSRRYFCPGILKISGPTRKSAILLLWYPQNLWADSKVGDTATRYSLNPRRCQMYRRASAQHSLHTSRLESRRYLCSGILKICGPTRKSAILQCSLISMITFIHHPGVGKYFI